MVTRGVFEIPWEKLDPGERQTDGASASLTQNHEAPDRATNLTGPICETNSHQLLGHGDL
jgi:hypothetical protein